MLVSGASGFAVAGYLVMPFSTSDVAGGLERTQVDVRDRVFQATGAPS